MLSQNQQRALQALLTTRNKTEAAKQAGISTRTLSEYLKQEDFQIALSEACEDVIGDATKAIQLGLTPAIAALREICEDADGKPTARIAAAKAILEYGLRFTEFADVLRQLQGLEA